MNESRVYRLRDLRKMIMHSSEESATLSLVDVKYLAMISQRELQNFLTHFNSKVRKTKSLFLCNELDGISCNFEKVF